MKLYIEAKADRDQTVMILARNGYTVRQGREKQGNKYVHFVEYWKEEAMTETQEQINVIKWGQQPSIRAQYPELALLFHIPNERKCTPAQGKQLKRAGVRSGVPDLCLPVPSGRYHGLFVEMKTEGGVASTEQLWWLDHLKAMGYATAVCYGWEKATEVLQWYLNLK